MIFRTGDMIAFKKSKTFFSKIVHLFTRSDVNHVALIVMLYNRNSTGFPFVIEANEDGVEYHYLPTILKEKKSELVVYKLKEQYISKINKNLDVFYAFLNKQIGKEYSTLDAIQTIIDKLIDKTVTKDNFQKFICSILVGAGYQNIGILTQELLQKAGFQCVSELTPIDCCNLPIFSQNEKITEEHINEYKFCNQ